MTGQIDGASDKKRLEGISGWLGLLAIGQILGPVQILRGMFQEYSSLPEGTASAFPTAVVGDAVLRLGFVALLIYTSILFFKKRIEFPKMFVRTYVAGLVLPFAVGIWVTATSSVNTMANLATSEFLLPFLVLAGIGGAWVGYVMKSERVRNTFVR
ncbi:DUF2569 family protein [Mesorhizobium sp. NBSH29]|uniref:DUF2569 domain-containing protein n=1 Tax=Mesorhizobium sp. NBSH29 TaxID=2654249 RepID=UPI0018967B25|nr:DUF2569 domain-containing protein [Mesorhizobium sp. NBSH29]QPC88403.1 DUF2569 family protein [Mesorhizobium sp. NBSH29]